MWLLLTYVSRYLGRYLTVGMFIGPIVGTVGTVGTVGRLVEYLPRVGMYVEEYLRGRGGMTHIFHYLLGLFSLACFPWRTVQYTYHYCCGLLFPGRPRHNKKCWTHNFVQERLAGRLL